VVPEALLAVNFLCTRVNRYVESDRKKMLRGVQYLNGRKHIGICLSCNQDIHVYIYADASYATHSDAKSHTKLFDQVVDVSSHLDKNFSWVGIIKHHSKILMNLSSVDFDLVKA
jgi:hypothetical protein